MNRKEPVEKQKIKITMTDHQTEVLAGEHQRKIAQVSPGIRYLIDNYKVNDEVLITEIGDLEYYLEFEVNAGSVSSFCHRASKLQGVCFADPGDNDPDQPISQNQTITVYLCEGS